MGVLVDTSVWIDHLHRAEPGLVGLLEHDEVWTHELVREEMAVGTLTNRQEILSRMGDLVSLPRLTHVEVLELVEARVLWGRGLSAVDVHLLGSILVCPGVALWTRDRRLRAAAAALGIDCLDPAA